MEILEIRSEGFGKLVRGFELESGLNVVIGPNQSGKSTLVSLVLSLLFGLDRSRPFAPWGGGAFAGEIDVALASGKHYRVARDFAKGEIRVTDLNDGRDARGEFPDAPGDGGPDVGSRLVALSRAAFLGSAVIRQGAHTPAEGEERESLLRSIRALVDTAGVLEETAEAALARLREALATYPGRLVGPGPVGGEIEAIESRVRDLGRKLDSLGSRRDEARELMAGLGEIARKLPALEQEQKAAELSGALARQRALASGRERLRGLLTERERLAVEAAGLAGTEGLSKEQLAELEREVGAYGAARAETEKLAESARSLVAEIEGLDDETVSAYTSLIETTLESRRKFVQMASGRREAKARREVLATKLGAEGAALAAKGVDAAGFEWLRSYFRRLNDDQIVLLRRDAEEEAASTKIDEEMRSEERDYRRTLTEVKANRVAAGRVGRQSCFLGLVFLAAGSGAYFAAPALDALIRDVSAAAFRGMGVAFVAVSLLLGVIGLGYLMSARTKGSRDLEEANQGLISVKRRRTEAAKKKTDREAAIYGLVAALGADGGTRALRERYLQYVAQKDVFEAFLKSQEQLEEQDLEIAALEREMESMLLGCGMLLAGDAFTDDVVEHFVRQAADLARHEEQIADLRVRRDAVQKDLRAREFARDEGRERIEEMLAAVRGEGPDGNGESGIEERVERFRRAVEGALRRQAIQSRELPEAQRRIEEALSDLRTWVGPCAAGEALGSLDEKIRGCGEKIAALRSAAQEREETTWIDTTDYEAEASRVSEERITLEKEQARLREALTALLAELDEAPDLAAEIEQWEAEKARIDRFQRAIGRAADGIETIARATHARWARKLNQTAGRILAKLSDSFGGMRFEDDLSFTLTSRSRGEPLSENDVKLALSQGARDLIYIAFRLALCRFLSGPGEPLPFILDDAFVSFDDGTHARAMDLLVEGADTWGHQVILLTCHEGMYRAWREGPGRNASVNEIFMGDGVPPGP